MVKGEEMTKDLDFILAGLFLIVVILFFISRAPAPWWLCVLYSFGLALMHFRCALEKKK